MIEIPLPAPLNDFAVAQKYDPDVDNRKCEPLLHWHGDSPPTPVPMLVDEMLPAEGIAILAGQSGVAKTFLGIDLSASIMTQSAFAGRAVRRRAGVLWLAAEGENELELRLRGVVEAKLCPPALGESVEPGFDPNHLPFAWQAGSVPVLTHKEARSAILRLASAATEGLAGLPLDLIVVDTLAAAAAFADENSSSEAQNVMNTLRAVSRETGALVLAIDHFGKLAETGVRGSSAKHAAADAVLAILADKDITGNVRNRRLVIHKLRAGATGREFPFNLRTIQMGDATTCYIDWAEVTEPIAAPASRNPWKGNARFLRSAIDVLADKAKPIRPFGHEGPEVEAIDREDVRREFYAAYPADGETSKAKSDARRQAFDRAIKTAAAAKLLNVREVSGVTWLWVNGGSEHDA